MHTLAVAATWLALAAGVLSLTRGAVLRRHSDGPARRQGLALILLGAAIELACVPRVANGAAWLVLVLSLLALLPLAGFVLAIRSARVDRR